jgi:HD-like signal output (HDOD) protein
MFPEETVQSFDLEKLPSGPRVLARLVSVVRQPHVDLAEVAVLFRADPALTARVVAASNSAYYGRDSAVTDIRDAVLQLGLVEVTRLVQVITLTDFRKYPTHLYSNTAGYFWERSLHTALVAEELGAVDPLAYTAGIMHLVGIWVLCGAFPAGHLSIAERELCLQADLEHLRLGVNFAHAGSQVLNRWGFPAAVSEAVRWQLTPSCVTEPKHFGLTKLLNRAVAIAEWHYGARNEVNLIRSDLTITDLDDCNNRAAEKVARIGFGF